MNKDKVKIKRIVKPLPEYTYLGCPMTRNRSPWCFRLCQPNECGIGQCGRVAPHSFKGRIQIGIINYDRDNKVA